MPSIRPLRASERALPLTLLVLSGLALAAACGIELEEAAPPAAVDVTAGGAATGAEDATRPGAAAPGPGADDARWSAALPLEQGPFAPSMARHDGQGTPEWFGEVETCAACHAEVADEWRTSAHAYSSFNNPFYRFNVDLFREIVGREPSQHCGGCHDLALLLDGAVMGAIDDPHDERALTGVTCNTCHGIKETTFDGNASYTVTSDPVPLPSEGDAASLAAHIARVRMPPLDEDALCVSCHRGFLGPFTQNPAHLHGLNDPQALQRSPQGGGGVTMIDLPHDKQRCVTCHMPEVDGYEAGRWRSHRFLGSHTALSAARGDAEALGYTQRFLEGAASIDVAALTTDRAGAAWPAERAQLAPGDRVTLDVVIRNQRVGHHFPGGTRDIQDTWVEVEVRDRAGRLLAEAGGEHAASGADPTAHLLIALILDEDGVAVRRHQTERFTSELVDHTVAARDAAVVQYTFEVPPDLDDDALPLSVTARLRHRRHPMDMTRAACDAARSPRGQAFAEGQRMIGQRAPDPCVEMPITEIAAVTRALGAAAPDADRPLWLRRYEHGLGWLRQLQERVGLVRPSLLAALAEVERDGSPREQAMVMALLARLETRQGRTEAALDWLDQAAALLPDHPAPHFLRGEALSAVWRWCEAAPGYRRALALAPNDDRVSSGLARALGSCGQQAQALEVAAQALQSRPRHTALLLHQSFALMELGAPAPLTERAQDAYLSHRPDDRTSDLRVLCAREVEGCSEQRLPIPVYALRPARPVDP